MGKIKVRGYAERKVEVDTARYTLTFTCKDLDASCYVDYVQSQSEYFLQKLYELGIDLKNVHLEDDDISTDYKTRSLKDYTRTISFDLAASSKNQNQIMNLIKKNSIKADFTVDYYYSKKKELHEELLKEAVLDSRKKAEIIASANNNRIIDIDYLAFDRYDYEETYEDRCCISVPNETYNSMLSDGISNKQQLESEEIFITWNIE